MQSATDAHLAICEKLERLGKRMSSPVIVLEIWNAWSEDIVAMSVVVHIAREIDQIVLWIVFEEVLDFLDIGGCAGSGVYV